jgi:hypothetical protein
VPGPEARPALATHGERRPAWLAAALLGFVLALGALSLALGQDLNFDLLNYHYYDGYAFLHGRTFDDIAPAGSQSFQPPLIHAFHYLGIAHLPPRLFGFLLGAVHGLNLPLVAALGLLVLPRGTTRAPLLALLAALAGSLGPAAVSLLGTTFGDNLVSIPALGALLLLLASASEGSPRRAQGLALAAGALAGAATGLKLTMAAYHVGLFAAALVLWRSSGDLARRLGLLGAGSLVGFAPTGGFWDLELWRRFGNPLFPFANGLFRSGYQSLENFRDTRFMARSAYDLLRPFVDTALGRSDRLMEIGMRDVRFALLLGAGLGVLLLAARARARGEGPEPLERKAAAFAAWWASSYLAWALAFYTYRYAALLEFTAPLLLVWLALRLVPARRALQTAALLTLAIVATTRVESWGRRAWQTPWLGLPVPALGLEPHSLVLVVGQPSAFAIPSFREDARFVNLTAVERFRAPLVWDPLVTEAVRDHRGPLLLLSNFEFSRAECEARVLALGLRPTESCEGFRNGALRFRLCELQRDEAH